MINNDPKFLNVKVINQPTSTTTRLVQLVGYLEIGSTVVPVKSDSFSYNSYTKADITAQLRYCTNYAVGMFDYNRAGNGSFGSSCTFNFRILSCDDESILSGTSVQIPCVTGTITYNSSDGKYVVTNARTLGVLWSY